MGSLCTQRGRAIARATYTLYAHMCRVLVLKTWGAEASTDLIHLSIILLSYRTIYVQRCTTPVNIVIEIIALKDKFLMTLDGNGRLVKGDLHKNVHVLD